MLRSIGKQSGESVESVRKKKRKAPVGKGRKERLRWEKEEKKRTVLSWNERVKR